MTQVVEKPDHPTPIWPERLEKLQHLLVRPSIPTRQVVDHHVLEVEIPDGHPIGVTMRDLECLGDTPLPDTVEGSEHLGSLGRADLRQRSDPLLGCRQPTEDISSAFLQMQLVEHPVGSVGHLLGVGRQSESVVWARSRIGERPMEPAPRRGRLAPGHLLATNSDDQRIKDQIGPAKSLPAMTTEKLGHDRVVRLEPGWVVVEPRDRPEVGEQPAGAFSPGLSDHFFARASDPQ